MEDHQAIGKAFRELKSDDNIDPNGHCIEYSYNDEDVKCMVRLKDMEKVLSERQP